VIQAGLLLLVFQRILRESIQLHSIEPLKFGKLINGAYVRMWKSPKVYSKIVKEAEIHVLLQTRRLEVSNQPLCRLPPQGIPDDRKSHSEA